MEVVNFNGLGQPTSENTADGDILVLFDQTRVSLVKLKILPEDDFGPELTPISNSEMYEAVLLDKIATEHKEKLKSDRHWVFTCPKEIKEALEKNT